MGLLRPDQSAGVSGAIAIGAEASAHGVAVALFSGASIRSTADPQ